MKKPRFDRLFPLLLTLHFLCLQRFEDFIRNIILYFSWLFKALKEFRLGHFLLSHLTSTELWLQRLGVVIWAFISLNKRSEALIWNIYISLRPKSCFLFFAKTSKLNFPLSFVLCKDTGYYFILRKEYKSPFFWYYQALSSRFY